MPKVVYTPVKGLVQEAGTNVGGAMLGFVHDAEPQVHTGGEAISVSAYVTYLTVTGAKSLPAGTIVGQLKKFMSNTNDNFTLTISDPVDSSHDVILFSDIGDTIELMWNGSAWRILCSYNTVNGAFNKPSVS